MPKGGKLYCEIARRVARRLAPVGQIDHRAEDQDDYHSKLWLKGCEAERKAQVCQKSDEHTHLSATQAVWNGARKILRDRFRAAKHLPLSDMDLDRIPVSVDLDAWIDARRAVDALRMYLSPEDWVLVEALADSDGGVLQACRTLGWEGSKSGFIRSVLELRARAKAIVERVAP